jgi:hypothetical protein
LRNSVEALYNLAQGIVDSSAHASEKDIDKCIDLEQLAVVSCRRLRKDSVKLQSDLNLAGRAQTVSERSKSCLAYFSVLDVPQEDQPVQQSLNSLVASTQLGVAIPMQHFVHVVEQALSPYAQGLIQSLFNGNRTTPGTCLLRLLVEKALA